MEEIHNNKKNTVLVFLIIILLIIILVLGVFSFYSINNTLNEKFDILERELEEIKKDIVGEYSTVIVTGYAELESEKYEIKDEIKYEGVYFNILNCENSEFLASIDNNTDNREVILGHLINNSIVFGDIVFNDSTGEIAVSRSGYRKLSTDITSRIINSTKENPIKIELTLYKIVSGEMAINNTSAVIGISIIE